MSGLATLAKKELWQQFKSPIAWVVIAGFSAFCSLWVFGVADFFATGVASLRPLFSTVPYALAVVCPALTMRLWSEELRSGTAEVLLSFPVSSAALVLSKLIATYAVVVCAIAATVLIPVVVSPFGDFDSGELLGQYLGLLLAGLVSVSVGQLTSVLARSQLTAFLAGVAVLMTLALATPLSDALGGDRAGAELFRFISTVARLDALNRGILALSDVTFFLVTAALALLATGVILDRRGGK